MTGLLMQAPGMADFTLALKIADAVAVDWNNNHKQTGITLNVSAAAVRNICSVGGLLLSSGAFPDSPGPYKRVAAFVVLAALYPIFLPNFSGPFDSSAQQCRTERLMHWNARFVHQCIAPCMATLSVELERRITRMPQWLGFPSLHYRLEFLGWLRWLNMGRQPEFAHNVDGKKWDHFQQDRLARMVLAASLILEACHYSQAGSGSTVGSIRGQTGSCLKDLDEDLRLDLYFDNHDL